MIKRIKLTFKYLKNHPLSKRRKLEVILKFLQWQLESSFKKQLIIKPWVTPLKLYLRKGLTGATGNYYVGLHDFEEMSFMLHFLDKKSIFCDIGANVGSYSLLASGLRNTKSYCFEPIPSTFAILQKNIILNNLKDSILAFNIGIGESEGKLIFSKNLDTVNHVLETKDSYGIEVPVKPLSDVLLKIPELIKIDVEGYEYFVLKGSNKILSENKLNAIIIELNGSGGRYGIEDNQVHEFLAEFKFIPVSYNPYTRKLKKLESFNKNGNTIYVRDFKFVQKKLVAAEELVICGRKF